jgi:Domain of unknown function (DUF4126)
MLTVTLLPPIPTGAELPAIIIVVSFSAGLNVYATVAMLGVLAHAHLLTLPPTLHLLQSWFVFGACAVLFLVEFIGDKIPVFDILWNALHTFVRIPAAALLTYAATEQLPGWERMLATLLGGLVALAAHGGKVAARAAVTPSPEPLSNIGLSLSEDSAVIFLTWFATGHPYAAAGIVVAALVIIAFTLRSVVRAMQRLFLGAEHALIHASREGLR